jgi:hypothetical protein
MYPVQAVATAPADNLFLKIAVAILLLSIPTGALLGRRLSGESGWSGRLMAAGMFPIVVFCAMGVAALIALAVHFLMT